jgi:hypothetical protein
MRRRSERRCRKQVQDGEMRWKWGKSEGGGEGQRRQLIEGGEDAQLPMMLLM